MVLTYYLTYFKSRTFRHFLGQKNKQKLKKKIPKITENWIFVKITSKKNFWWWNNHILLLTLIENFNYPYFRIFVAEVWKNEQLKFTINVNNKKWLFCHQKFIFDVIFTKVQFSVIFGIFFSVFAYFLDPNLGVATGVEGAYPSLWKVKVGSGPWIFVKITSKKFFDDEITKFYYWH